MTNPYPKPRWDLENDVLRLEQMIILYEQEIAELKIEKEELKEEVTLLFPLSVLRFLVRRG